MAGDGLVTVRLASKSGHLLKKLTQSTRRPGPPRLLTIDVIQGRIPAQSEKILE